MDQHLIAVAAQAAASTLLHALFISMPVASQSRQSADGWKLLEEAQEIINIGAVLTGHPEEPVATYKSSGSNPISERAVAVRSGALLG
jgi:hypothetical protein